MKKDKLILDTSVFVNPASGQFFGRSPTSAFVSFLEMAKATKGLEVLMPLSVHYELMHFLEEKQVPKSLQIIIEKRSPKKHEIKVPGIFIYDLVNEIRGRTDRGLRLAERHVREALDVVPHPKKSPSDRDQVRHDADVIGRLRDSYRRIMREGMLDSKADADLLLLTYETDGKLVTADQGVMEWAEKLGLSVLVPENLVDFLKQHSAAVPPL